MSPKKQQRVSNSLTEAQAALKNAKNPRPAEASKETKKKQLRFATPEDELTKSAIKLRDMKQTSALRMRLASFAIVAVSFQLAVANIFFGYYLWETRAVGIEPSVMIAWLSATVVEVVGIIVIVARNLFPSSARLVRRRDIERVVKAVQASE